MCSIISLNVPNKYTYGSCTESSIAANLAAIASNETEIVDAIDKIHAEFAQFADKASVLYEHKISPLHDYIKSYKKFKNGENFEEKLDQYIANKDKANELFTEWTRRMYYGLSTEG